MGEKKTIKASLLTFFLILAIIAIVVMAYFLYKLNNEKIAETEKVADLQNEISNLETTDNNLNDKINNSDNSNVKEDNINYIEMTETNYKKYNSNGYQFEIADMISNANNTVTIKGRVYKLKELPTLSKKQYQDLIDGKTITLMGYEMKINGSEDNVGHDFVIESTGDWMKFYVDQDSDGTGKLFDYTEAALYEGTDTYMQITVDKDISTESGSGNIPLKQYLNNWSGMAELKDTEMLPSYNTEFIFENGKCSSIVFTGV